MELVLVRERGREGERSSSYIVVDGKSAGVNCLNWSGLHVRGSFHVDHWSAVRPDGAQNNRMQSS